MSRWQKFYTRTRMVITTITRHYQMANVSDSAVVLAYYLLLSLFPALLVLASLLPYLHIDTQTVLNGIEPIVPESIYDMLGPIIHSFLNRRSGGVLSIGVVVALWSSSRAVAAFQRTVNRAYGVAEHQNALVNRVGAFFWMVVLIALMFGLMLVFSFSQIILEQLTPLLHLPTQILTYVNAVRWPVTFVVTFFILLILFFFVPNARLKWRFVWPGALIAAMGWLLLSQAFSLYLKYFMHNIDSYKTIGTFIVLMFWLDFTGMILMFGAVVNASIQELVAGPAEEQAQLRQLLRRRNAKKE
ncbi:YihY/virulence factor BrkB family protein [Levilactobacillus zymae]|uniref:YihY/virulence factor BrkB family protein n=1 Tax=Levilactobacillus zymae TaxID=267363 RepID=UPI0028BC84AA|nr:YihY/virulence factor BrkB family protein [Levilactobacillus zymae]MDT6980248.1 YihY/virulence factor BrkB family protein [Levilactobacillus zymae]